MSHKAPDHKKAMVSEQAPKELESKKKGQLDEHKAHGHINFTIQCFAWAKNGLRSQME
jgi:hypothetical protein